MHDKNRERKTRQVTILVKPSVYTKMQHIGKVWNKATNQIIEEALEEFAIHHQDQLEVFRQMEAIRLRGIKRVPIKLNQMTSP